MNDLFISNKRNVKGQFFGFVCFDKVCDTKKLSRALNNIFHGQLRAWTNVANFDRFLRERKSSVKVGGFPNEGEKKLREKKLSITRE